MVRSESSVPHPSQHASQRRGQSDADISILKLVFRAVYGHGNTTTPRAVHEDCRKRTGCSATEFSVAEIGPDVEAKWEIIRPLLDAEEVARKLLSPIYQRGSQAREEPRSLILS